MLLVTVKRTFNSSYILFQETPPGVIQNVLLVPLFLHLSGFNSPPKNSVTNKSCHWGQALNETNWQKKWRGGGGKHNLKVLKGNFVLKTKQTVDVWKDLRWLSSKDKWCRKRNGHNSSFLNCYQIHSNHIMQEANQVLLG